MLLNIIFVYFVFSFTGWLIELIFRSIYEKKPVNPGFHKGPWLPIYGFAGIIIYLVSGILSDYSLFLHMVLYFILCTSLEFLAGVFLERAYNCRFWDYSENWFNIRGFVCLKYSAAWVIISTVVELFLLPELQTEIAVFSERRLLQFDTVLLGLFSIDFLYSSGIISSNIQNRLKGLFN